MLSQFDACSQAHGTNCASIYAPPSGVSCCSTLFSPRRCRVVFLRYTQKPQHRHTDPFPLHYANSAKRFTQPTGRALHSYVISGHLPWLRSRSRTTCSLRDPGSPWSPPSGKIASGPRIRAKSFVSLRTEPGFCGPHQSCSPLHGQNSSSLRSSQNCPFRPLYSYVATQPNREDPSGKRLLLRPFPLSQ